MDRVLESLTLPIARGERYFILAYKGRDGRVMAQEFLNALKPAAQKRYIVHFVQMCQDGFLRGEHMHPWDPDRNPKAQDLKCFKDNGSQSRIPCFPSGDPGVLVLTHGFGGKKENKLDDAQINHADAVRREFHARVAEMRAKGVPSTDKRISGGRR